MRWQRLIPRIVIGGPFALIIAGLVFHGGSAPQGGYLRHSHRMVETSQSGTAGDRTSGNSASLETRR